MEINNEIIGRNIKQARKRCGLTQEVLCEKLNITINHLSNVERGAKSMGLSTLAYTAEVLHTTLDELVFGASGKEKSLEGEELKRNIKYYLERMNDSQLEYTLKQIEVFVNTIRSLEEEERNSFIRYE